jgi:deoxyribonuclease-4
VEAASELACDCLQVFVKNQRQWSAPPLALTAVDRFKAALERTGVGPVVAHASYLVNLGSPDEQTRTRSVAALEEELARCQMLGIPYLVVHPGATLDAPKGVALRYVARSLDEIRAARRSEPREPMILLETTAGQGTTIGHRLEHLADILAAVREPARIGVCLDTCHLFAAGYDFREPEAYAGLMDAIDRTTGLSAVRCVHVNDSKRELGSRVDRHEHIGIGKIGKRGFAHFLNDPRWAHTPMILETPKGTDGRGTDLDKVNLNRLRSLVGRPTK